jgi:hypothetical protein
MNVYSAVFKNGACFAPVACVVGVRRIFDIPFNLEAIFPVGFLVDNK